MNCKDCRWRVKDGFADQFDICGLISRTLDREATDRRVAITSNCDDGLLVVEEDFGCIHFEQSDYMEED